MSTASLDSGLPLGETLDQARERHRREWLGFLAISMGSFIAILDIQIVASSINQIQAGLSASADEIQWVQTAYLIAEVIAIPLSGYLSRLMSTRLYFTLSALGFTLASLACVLAWDLPSMILFRTLQGFLGGGMIPTAFAAMFLLFPEAKRRALPQLIGGLMAILAPSIGPSVGGYLTGIASWHWLFLVNLGPGLLCAWGVWSTVRLDQPQPQIFKLTDWPGLAFLALFLGCLTYALDEGPRVDWFANRSVALCSLLAAVGGALFFWRMFSCDHPIVDLRAFRNRNFALTSLVSLVLGMSMFTLIYLTPLFLGRVRGYSALQIGEVMAVQGMAMFLTAPLAGRLSRRMDPRQVIAVGLVLVATGSWLNGHMSADWGHAQFLWPQVLRGAGMIFAFIPMTNLALGTLPSEAVKNASGLYTVTRNLGGAIGLALVGTLLNGRLWLHWQDLAATLHSERSGVYDYLHGAAAQLGPGGESDPRALGLLNQLAQQQALTMAYNDMYLLLSALVAATLLLVPLIEKPRPDTEVGVAH